jgi:hypothetical protein
MLRMLPAEPMLRMLPALAMLRMLPALSRLPTERKLRRLQMLSPFASFRAQPRLSIPSMIARFVFGALLFLVVGYSAWWIAWYSGTQSGNGSTLPTPPYANMIANQGNQN